MSNMLEKVVALEASGARAAIVTVVRVSGSTPRAPGARMIVHEDGKIEGTIGGGKLEHQAIEEAQLAIKERRTRYLDFALTQQLGMCCGGKMGLFIEPLQVAPRLIIFGAGHVGTALCRMAAQAGFVVHVADERDELRIPERLAEARQLHEDLEDPNLPFAADCFVMITTHDHGLDQQILERALALPHCWIGVIGSRRKSELTRERLLHKGFSPDVAGKVRIPVGVAIGAETPEEIAVSILGELIAVRRDRLDGVKLEHKEPVT